jgi:hypothetical protein
MCQRSRPGQATVGAALLVAASPALAHGEEAAVMVPGNFIALGAVLVAAVSMKVDWASRVLAPLIAFSVEVSTYILIFGYNRYMPYSVLHSGVVWFVVGLVPPLVVSGLFLFWRRKARQRRTL